MQVIIASEVAVQRERLRQGVLGVGLRCGANDCVAFRDLPGRLLQGPAELILVGLGADPATALPLIERIAAQGATPVFAAGQALAPDEILQTLRAGAREYLDENKLRDELLALLKKLRQAGAAPLRWGRVLAVTGAAPGSGVTTVATNLAFALAARHPGEIALAEVHAGAPELALDLDLQPRHPLADLASVVDRLDPTLLRNVLLEHPARLSVLADQPENLAGPAWQPGAIKQLLAVLRTQFAFTVIDLGHTLDAAWREVLTTADTVLVVSRLDVPALRLNRHLVTRLEELGIGADKLHAVVNRYGQRGQFPWKKAAKALGLPVEDWIPEDPARVNHALNEGRPLVQTAPRTAITRCFDQLAARLTARPHSKAG